MDTAAVPGPGAGQTSLGSRSAPQPHLTSVAVASVTSDGKPYGVWPLAGTDDELSYIVLDRSTRWIDRKITLRGALDDDQRATMARIAEKTPVTMAVRAGTEIRTAVR